MTNYYNLTREEREIKLRQLKQYTTGLSELLREFVNYDGIESWKTIDMVGSSAAQLNRYMQRIAMYVFDVDFYPVIIKQNESDEDRNHRREWLARNKFEDAQLEMLDAVETLEEWLIHPEGEEFTKDYLEVLYLDCLAFITEYAGSSKDTLEETFDFLEDEMMLALDNIKQWRIKRPKNQEVYRIVDALMLDFAEILNELED